MIFQNMSNRTILPLLLFPLLTLLGLCSCIEDGFTTSPSDQPSFASDTVSLGQVFTEEGTATRRFVVYNRHDKMLNISHISIRPGGSGAFRVNVDGLSGEEFDNVEIRPNDSIYVFVEATLPHIGELTPVEITDILDFVTNGRTSSVILHAMGQDAERLTAMVVEEDTRWESGLPKIIYDSLVVAPGVRLTLGEGVRLHFHDKASFVVRGTLVSEGTPQNPVLMEGDRTGNVISGVSFDIMAGQWGGVEFLPTSCGNRLSHTLIRNTQYGVVADSTDLYLLNCRLRNSQFYSLATAHTDLTAIGCELSDASEGVVYVRGGKAVFNHCTIANYYLFSALGGPAVRLAHTGFEDKKGKIDDDGSGLPYLIADFDNCIIYGNGSDLSHPDLAGTGVRMRHTLLKSEGSDDDNFIGCLWGVDPLYYTVREEYVFDYRLHPESPAVNAADPSLTSADLRNDYFGTPRTSTLGAFEPSPE